MPELEDDEMFNSGFLKDHISQQISAGRRNFAIDLSPLDYIYSDSINVLMVLNKRALEVGGRLALLTPQPEVVGILQKAGIQSIMRVFASEAELMAASDEIMASSAGYKVTDLAGAGQALSEQSEFDSLRSEIGSVFGEEGFGSTPPGRRPPAMMSPPPSPPVMPPPPPPMMAPPPPKVPELRPMSPPPPPPMMAPPPPRVPELKPMSPPPPPPPKAPEFPPPPPRVDAFGGFGAPSAPAPSSGPAFGDEDGFDDIEFGGKGKKKKKEKVTAEEDFGGFDDDDMPKKKSPIVPIIAAAAVVVLAVVGVVVFTGGDKSEDTSVAVAQPPAPEPTPTETEPTDESAEPAEQIATVSVETPSAQPSAPPAKVAAPPPSKKAAPPPPPSKKAAPPPAKTTQAKAPPPPPPPPPPPRPAPTPAPPAPPPPPPPPAPPPKPQDQLVIRSTPSGATVEIDGRRRGTTPLTIKPDSWGDMTIVVSMSGFETARKTIEFEGGTVTESFTLSRPAPAAPPPPPPPPQAAPPPPPPPPPPPAAPAASGASIFIASLPSGAQVYIGGRMIGTTGSTLSVPVGTHQVRFVRSDGVERTHTRTFQAGQNVTWFVNLNE